MGGKARDDRTVMEQAAVAGDHQDEAVPINDFIYLSQDVSNSYLVLTPHGDVAINAGTLHSGPRHRARYAAVSKGPLRYLVLTQSHTDHFGGAYDLVDSDTTIIAQADYPRVRDYWIKLAPFYGRRAGKLWAQVLGDRVSARPREVVPHVLFEKEHRFELGGRRFELYATPGGETTDSSIVWMPDEKVVFTGNLFGPLFMCVPNFNTLRGDKMRSIGRFLESLEIVRGLGAELLITGHGEPIRGGAEIAAKLNRLRDGVRYIHDQTIAGMNAGKDVHTLMREIRLPPELALEESYGNVIWAVRTIWLEYTGWFHFDGTTDLYDVPVGSVAPDLLQLAGGSRKIAARAAQYVSEGQPLQALHLIELTLPAAPSDRALLEVKIDAQKALLARQDGNFHSTMWLKADIAEVEKQLAMKSQEMHDHQARKA